MLGSHSITGKWFKYDSLKKLSPSESIFHFRLAVKNIMIYKKIGKKFIKQKLLKFYK